MMFILVVKFDLNCIWFFVLKDKYNNRYYVDFFWLLYNLFKVIIQYKNCFI